MEQKIYSVVKIFYNVTWYIASDYTLTEAYKLRDWMQLEATKHGWKHSELRYAVR